MRERQERPKERPPASPGLPLGGVCDFHAYRHDSRQVFGLAGCLLAPASQSGFRPRLDSNRTSAYVGAFVPAYRCGAVPDLRRIPFSGEALRFTTESRIDYIVSLGPGQQLYVVVSVEILTTVIRHAGPDKAVLIRGSLRDRDSCFCSVLPCFPSYVYQLWARKAATPAPRMLVASSSGRTSSE
jgi:hypothetical protein